jgi:SAM-dependent methyltransferase
MREHGPQSWRLVGVDNSPAAVRSVRAKGFEAVQGRFEELDVAGGQADAIVLNQVIEHLDDPGAVVARAREILRPDGCLFIETPCLDGWDARLFRRRYWGGWHFPRHWTLFTRDSLSELLLRNGFRIEGVTWLLSPNFWIQSLHHWLVDKGVPEKAAGWMDCRNPLALACFASVDCFQKLFGHTSNMRIVARRSV